MKPQPKLRAHRPRGFTLVEVLCASAVFMVGFAGIIAADIATGNFTARSKHQTAATAIATSLVNLAQTLAPADLQQMGGGATTVFNIDAKTVDAAGGAPFYTATTTLINFSQGGTSLPCVRVVVQWTEPYTRSQQNVALEGCPSPS